MSSVSVVVATEAQKSFIDDSLMPKEEDLLYEEELLRNPYSLKMWNRYIQARTDATAKRRYLLYERALRALPGSYKVSRVPVGAVRSCTADNGVQLCKMSCCSYGMLSTLPYCFRIYTWSQDCCFRMVGLGGGKDVNVLRLSISWTRLITSTRRLADPSGTSQTIRAQA